jgi:uncharacterized protein YbaR (Trm112 family)
MATENKPFDYACPHCKQKFEVPPEMIGQETTCPSCNKIFLIIDPKLLNKPVPKPALICPNVNCKYKGIVIKKRRGNPALDWTFVVMLALPVVAFIFLSGQGLLSSTPRMVDFLQMAGGFYSIFIPFAVIWNFTFCAGYRYRCPNCGIQVACDN